MPIATLTDASIHYDVSGNGDPTVLVHGSLVDRTTWNAVCPGLSQALRVLVYDRRGHGESTGIPRTRPVRDDAGDLANLLHSVDLYPAHLIAHSYGAAVALRLASDRPEMVRSLVLHEPPFVGLLEEDPATAPEADRIREEMRAMDALARGGQPGAAARAIVNSLSADDGAWDRLRSETRQNLARHVDRWVEEMADPEATRPEVSTYSDLLIPVLLTTGERSPPFLHRVVARLADRLRNSTVRTLPGVGHAPHLSDPDQFIAFVYGFLVERNVPFT